MGLQAIEAAPKDGSRVFLADQNTGDMTTAHWVVREGVSFQGEGASIAFSSAAHWLPGSKTVERLRGRRRVVARASVAAGMCGLWLFIGAVGDNGLCGETDARAQAFAAPTEKGRKTAQSNAMRDESLLVSKVVETTVVEQKQNLERGCEKSDILADRLIPIRQLDAAQGNAAQAPQSAPPWKRKQALEHVQECESAEVLARALTSSLRGELDGLRSAAEAARIKQKQALDQERDRADALARELASLWVELDTARIAGSEVQAAEAQTKQKQALDQERDRADALARELTSVRAELDKARIAGSEAVQAAEAERKQKQALEQEPGRADTLARELTSLRAELDAARIAGSEAVQAAEAERKQKQALEQERGRADTLVRELTSVRAELDKARIAGSEAVQAAQAETKQKHALEQERGGAEALARELTSLRAELDTARAARLGTVRTAKEAEVEQRLAFGKERDKSETLARELASARKEAEERSARLAAAHAEVVQVTETNRAIAAKQKLALASERDRADALTRELASVRKELEAGNRQIAALNALHALQSRGSAVDSSQERMTESSSRTTEGKGPSPEQISAEAAASGSERSSAPELPRPEPQSTAREAASDLGPKVAMAIERSTSSASAASSRTLVDEQRLLARANALLRQGDISGARLMLEHALERGSARAAFMLAETYDAHVLRSWRARGISGDLTKARELYERAQAGGIEDAKERIETLK
jgi:hypothetical protein